jgi:chemotaxis protein CheD
MSGTMRAEESGRPTIQVVGIGELVVSNAGDGLITTHAIGSCIAVCIFDPVAGVAGMLHFLLPESRVNPARARQEPGVFADTGIPLLFQTAYEYGLSKRRVVVKLVGGAEMAADSISTTFTTGRRNALAARNLLWRNGVFVAAEDVGGDRARSLQLSVRDGRLRVYSGEMHKEL